MSPNGEVIFIRIPDKLVEHWQATFNDRATFEEERGHWDYVYSVSDLIDLKGNRFHKKKNLLNQFVKKYEYTYVPFETAINRPGHGHAGKLVHLARL